MLSEAGRKRLKFVAQALISACLIGLVFRQIDLERAKSLALDPVRLPWLLLALFLFNASKVASALRLNLYQRHASLMLSERENLKLTYAGMFLNLFLPGGIGGDGYKILVLHRRTTMSVKKLLGILLADRVSGLLILLLLLCMLLPVLQLPWSAVRVDLLAVGIGVAVMLVSALGHLRLLKMPAKLFSLVFAYGVAVQVLQLLSMGALVAYLNVPIQHWLSYLAVFLVSSIAAVMPLSFGGLGAREITFLYGLDLLHLDPTRGVVASSLFFLITVVSSLVGALFLSSFSLRTQQAPSP